MNNTVSLCFQQFHSLEMNNASHCSRKFLSISTYQHKKRHLPQPWFIWIVLQFEIFHFIYLSSLYLSIHITVTTFVEWTIIYLTTPLGYLSSAPICAITNNASRGISLWLVTESCIFPQNCTKHPACVYTWLNYMSYRQKGQKERN